MNKMLNNQSTYVSLMLTVFGFQADALASETHRKAHNQSMEEVVVSMPFVQKAAETSQPINILSGEALLEDVNNTLGGTLQGEIGINSASFGPGVGHPIIRGHTGNRVGILQNGVGTTDVANQSPDHAESVDVSLADRIEIVRGPASLLYGSGAIGGIVNIIDGRVPDRVPESTELLLEQTRNFNNDEDRTAFRIDAGKNNFAIHAEGFSRKNDNQEIPGFALDVAAIEALEEIQHGDEEHEEHEEEEEAENTLGFIGNSNGKSSGGALGFSFVGESGFIGFSVSALTNEYGLPPGSHEHAHGHEEEEGHDDDHDDDHDGDHDDHGEEHGEEEVDFVRLEMDKVRYDLRGGLKFGSGFIESVDAAFAFTDYTHDEVEFFSNGETEVGTTFDNEGYEGRVVAHHRGNDNWSGLFGIQLTNNDFVAAGEEGFIPESDIQNLGLFAFERYQTASFNIELGLRYDTNQVESGQCESDENAFSASGSILYDVNESSNVFFGMTNAVRTPSVEELFANVDNTTCGRPADDEALVLHAATNLLEIGNPNLTPERAQNFELGYRYHTGPITGEINAYANNIDDYIFLNVTGAEFEEQLLGEFTARDTKFRGLEARLSFDIYQSEQFGISGSVFGDQVHAKFDAGGNVPLIPASKVGAEIEFYGDQWTVHLRANNVFEQDNVGDFELPTDEYTLFSLYADYHWNMGNEGELKLFLRADNLSDEEVRNHASRLKNFAPEPGRTVKVGLRYRL